MLKTMLEYFLNSLSIHEILLFLLMPVLPQTFFTFVGCHLVSFPLFSVWHNNTLLKVKLFNFVFNFVYKSFCGFKCRNVVCRNNDGCIF